MLIDKLKSYSILLFSILLLLTSCVDESFVSQPKEGYMLISGINTRSYNGSQPGDGIDSRVETLRILAFDKTTKSCESNVFYSGSTLVGGSLRHPIDQGEYDFVFLANEPPRTDVQATLEGISNYADIQSIAFSAAAFNSDDFIPMIAEVKAIKIMSNGNIEVNGSVTTNLSIKLRRLAARVDVILKSKIDLGTAGSGSFEGVRFSNIPDRIPLVDGLPNVPPAGSWIYDDPDLSYSGPAINRTIERKFTLADNAEYFEINSSLLSPDDRTNGLVWAVKVKRVILPSSFFTDKDNEAKAIVFTVDLIDKYSPSCQLKIMPDPIYTLPANAKLDLTATIKEPLEMNILASPWEAESEDWEIAGNRILNVSNIRVSMTDYNGVRISFWSNMPKVRVIPTVEIEGSGTEETNFIFNDLAVTTADPSLKRPENTDPTRFYYDPATGFGYMDLLVNGDVENTPLGTVVGDQTGIYRLVLSAENEDGTNALQRTIHVDVKQYGYRFNFSTWEWGRTGYAGAFFRSNEKGERVITGQNAFCEHVGGNYRTNEWTAKVINGDDFITLSSTPSFDPTIGTDNPGDPEKYPVVPNQYKGETGKEVKGKGRIYFRIGMQGDNPNKGVKPRYGVVEIKYREALQDQTYFKDQTWLLYVRQGEEDDYIFSPSDPMVIGTESFSGRDAARKFSPYNLTSQFFLDNPAPSAGIGYADVGRKGGRFVKYPTQAGAMFQWGIKPEYNRVRAAYYPIPSNKESQWGFWTGIATNENTSTAIWFDVVGRWFDTYRFWNTIGADLETCPTVDGKVYKRPSDGRINAIARNHTAEEVKLSEWRVSLFKTPKTGDHSTVANNYPYPAEGVPGLYVAEVLDEITYGFYADGFYDRRPIQKGQSADSGTLTDFYGVSINNANAAYRGTLFHNNDTNASLFFPSAGRRFTSNGRVEYVWAKGYYTSTSIANGWLEPNNSNVYTNAWTFELNYKNSYPVSQNTAFGLSLRCVRE